MLNSKVAFLVGWVLVAGSVVVADEPTYRVESNITQTVVCPDDTLMITFTVRIRRGINGKVVWDRAGNLPAQTAVLQELQPNGFVQGDPAGSIDEILDSGVIKPTVSNVKTDPRTGTVTVLVDTGSVVGTSGIVWFSSRDIFTTADADYTDDDFVSFAIWHVRSPEDKENSGDYPAVSDVSDAIGEVEQADNSDDFVEKLATLIEAFQAVEPGGSVSQQGHRAVIRDLTRLVEEPTEDFLTVDLERVLRTRDGLFARYLNDVGIDREPQELDFYRKPPRR